MEIKNLIDICEINDKSVEKFEGIKKYVATGDVDYNKIISFDEVNYDDKPSRANREVEIGDILVAKMKETVKVAKITEENYDKYIFSTGFSTLKAKEDKLNTDYLYYVLISDYFQSQKDKYSKGATQKAINNAGLKKIKIPVPPINIQKQIVEILDEAQSLIDNRKEQIKLLDDLIESIFYDMFGDPVRNNNGWRINELGETCELITGNTPPRKNPENYGNEIEWIKSDNINTPYIYLTEAEEFLSEEGKKIGRFVGSGSILMTCIAGSISCIGNIAITDREVAFNQQINAIVPQKYNLYFLYVLFLSTKEYIQNNSTSSMKGMISKGKLSKLEFIIPPLSLQNQFALKVEQIELQKQLLDDSLKLLEDNYNSLMQKAFKGELFN